MLKKKISIDWRERFQINVERFGGSLGLHCNLDHIDVGVLMFLLMRKWYTSQTVFSKNSIANELNALSVGFKPAKYRVQFTPKRVLTSILKLEANGFVKKCKNEKKQKTGHRNPDYVYESTDVTELQTMIEREFDKTKRDIKNVLGYLGTSEEDALTLKSEKKENFDEE